jgi:hypothetical protein
MPDLIRHPDVLNLLDSGFRRNDRKMEKVTFYETVKLLISPNDQNSKSRVPNIA